MDAVVLCGLPASGKTTAGARLHAALGGALIRSCDVYRDLGIDLPAWVRRTGGLRRGVGEYERARDGAYVEMTRRLAAALGAEGPAVVVDAVHERTRRAVAYATCRAAGVTPAFVWCRCDINETRRRIEARAAAPAAPESEAAAMAVYHHLAGLWDDPRSDAFDGPPPPLLAYDSVAARLTILRGDGATVERIAAALAGTPARRAG